VDYQREASVLLQAHFKVRLDGFKVRLLSFISIIFFYYPANRQINTVSKV